MPTTNALTNYLANKLQDHALRNVSYTPAATVYVALFTTAPDKAGAGTEVTGGAYARQAVTFIAAVAGLCSNSADINFPVATADWGTVTHFAIYDALTGGNMLEFGQLENSITIVTNGQFKFLTGQLQSQLL